MGLLDKLWDDVVAGPQPDCGLGRLRKGPRMKDETMDDSTRMTPIRRQSAEFQRAQGESRQVTQSIPIVKPPLLCVKSTEPDCGSAPSTPGGFSSSPGLSSLLGSPRGSFEGPATPNTPVSPSVTSRFSVPHNEKKKVMQKFASEKYNRSSDDGSPVHSNKLQKAQSQNTRVVPPSSPTVYDWVVLSAIDR